MYSRAHHQRIAHILHALDGKLLGQYGCLFGGGTCIALRHGEYRESRDIDFLVSDATGYRQLRTLLTGAQGLNALIRTGAPQLAVQREVRADQYGIRTYLLMDGEVIKFEIVFEARFKLSTPRKRDLACDVPTLTVVDLAASTLLANSDRHADDSVFSRDLIDLAMMKLPLADLRSAHVKASEAYGSAISRDLQTAITRAGERAGWLERCIEAMALSVPKALLWQNIRSLRRIV